MVFSQYQLNALRSVRETWLDLMHPRRSARLTAQRPAIPELISLDNGDTESIFSAVCETCNQPENSGSLQHFPCGNYLAHRACVDDGVDAICPFCRMDLRELLEGGPAVQCPLCRGPVHPQGVVQRQCTSFLVAHVHTSTFVVWPYRSQGQVMVRRYVVLCALRESGVTWTWSGSRGSATSMVWSPLPKLIVVLAQFALRR